MEQEKNMLDWKEMPVYPQLLTGRSPDGVAVVKGGPEHPGLQGRVWFWQSSTGTVVSPWVEGLPVGENGPCGEGVFALHLHEGGACTGTEEKPFADAEGHYNPDGCEHPFHRGDLPPLFADRRGKAWYAVLSDRFTVEEVLGRTVITHARQDDFTTQPSGNAGEMIACGVIRKYTRE